MNHQNCTSFVSNNLRLINSNIRVDKYPILVVRILFHNIHVWKLDFLMSNILFTKISIFIYWVRIGSKYKWTVTSTSLWDSLYRIYGPSNTLSSFVIQFGVRDLVPTWKDLSLRVKRSVWSTTYECFSTWSSPT